jgi:hypothetical protein
LEAAGARDIAAARAAAAQRKEHLRRASDISKEMANLAPGNRSKQLAAGLEALKGHLGELRGPLAGSNPATPTGRARFATHQFQLKSDVTSRPRGAMRPGCADIFRPREQRAQGRPGARCTRGLMCKLGTGKRT